MKQMRSDLRAYEPVETVFALRSAELRKARDQRDYLTLCLSDRSGTINGYLWEDPVNTADLLKGQLYVHIEGSAKMHNGALIISISHAGPARDEEIDQSDLFEIVPGGVDLWVGKLNEHIAFVRDGNCRSLIQCFLDDVAFVERFKISAAGLKVHHNYIGGLLEHTVCTMANALHVSDQYPALLDRDLLLTGSFVHDIGKIREIAEGAGDNFTTEGKLLGHIPIGFLMVANKIRRLRQFPPNLAMLILHMVLSHHGQLEFGSPVRPASPEALALNLIENTDSKMNHLYNALKDLREDDEWSVYDKYLQTELCQLKFKRQLVGEAA